MEPVIENTLRDVGFNVIAGLDEVGKGALMGPVVVGCVVLPVKHRIEGIKDSKKFTGPNAHKNRIEVSALIYGRAFFAKVYEASHEEVDALGIHNAIKKCMLQGIKGVGRLAEVFVVDGRFDFSGVDNEVNIICWDKADQLSEACAAASIIAKSHRDSLVIQLDEVYPEYNFFKHKGYGTSEHMKAILKYGPCPVHRKSFSVKGRKIGDL